MLIPPPGPAYTLAPGLDMLSPRQQAALERCLNALPERVCSVLVTAVRLTDRHSVVELATTAGPLLMIEPAGEPVVA